MVCPLHNGVPEQWCASHHTGPPPHLPAPNPPPPMYALTDDCELGALWEVQKTWGDGELTHIIFDGWADHRIVSIEFFGQDIPLADGHAEFSYIMPQGVAKGTVNIANSSGVNVFFADADTSSGKHTIKWDGKDKSGNQLGDDVYTLLVSGQDSSGKLMEVEHLVVGPVTGAGVDDGVVKLFINGALTVEQDKVLSVRKPIVQALEE